MSNAEPTDRGEFIRAAHASAFHVHDPESIDNGRALIHCQSGGIGADWDLNRVIDEIRSADEVLWDTESLSALILQHHLVCVTDGHARRFGVMAPSARTVDEPW